MSLQNTITEFAILFTSQKHKKAKTWQDGTLKYYSFNAKAVLSDEKDYIIDKLFMKSRLIHVGDELEFERFLVTVESQIGIYSDTGIYAKDVNKRNIPSAPIPTVQSPLPVSKFAHWHPVTSDFISSSKKDTSETVATHLPSKRLYPDVDVNNVEAEKSVHLDENMSDCFALQSVNEHAPCDLTQKRRKVGLTKQSPLQVQTLPNNLPDRSSDTSLQLNCIMNAPLGSESNQLMDAHTMTRNPLQKSSSTRPPTKSSFVQPAASLCFPDDAYCKANKKPLRVIQIPSIFTSPATYKETFERLIYEHLQVLTTIIAISYRSFFPQGTRSRVSEQLCRSNGIGFYEECSLNSTERFCSVQRNSANTSSSGVDQNYSLILCNKEHHSLYGKDDIWIISKTANFDTSSTFLARSSYYGPSSSGSVDIRCISTKGARIAKTLKDLTKLYAIRGSPANSEFMMLDNLENINNTPLLPMLINAPSLRKSGTNGFKPPARVGQKSGFLIVQEDHLEKLLAETAAHYKLNDDQEKVLRAFARLTIKVPEWDEKAQDTPSVVLVHGVFGSGKSYLIAVLIIFLNQIAELLQLNNSEDDFRILVTSMTNVAVDGILMTLQDLGYNKFVRVGSLKKIAKRILPHTAQMKLESDNELKELNSILMEDHLAKDERQYVEDAIKKFKIQENSRLTAQSSVVGTTCMASTFEIFENMRFSLVILDESSQIPEPMAMVPIAKFGCEKLLMVGDPYQLPPTISSPSDQASIGKGLDRTLFDRVIEMGIEPIMLRTQYRCHPKISAISNKLFYSHSIINGVSVQDRSPLVQGLPTLCFVNVQGEEIQKKSSKSFFNEAEIKAVITLISKLLDLGVEASHIGVIALYKEQADLIDIKLKATVSTVDAFQGSEKNIIILSCVRSRTIGFSDNAQRVNVALTRAKRHLIILGDKMMLESNPTWHRIIIDHCKDDCINAEALLSNLDTAKLAVITQSPKMTGYSDLRNEDETQSSTPSRQVEASHFQLLSPSGEVKFAKTKMEAITSTRDLHNQEKLELSEVAASGLMQVSVTERPAVDITSDDLTPFELEALSPVSERASIDITGEEDDDDDDVACLEFEDISACTL